ncbi:N-acetylmuramoyl-L-alanine amidase [Lachnospiraceae bacterium 62-35]
MAERRQVIIDAGHGGEEPGAVFEGRKEKDDNLRLALLVGQALERAGVDVLYTRTDDIYQSPAEKADIANRSNADYFISIHRNAMPVPGTASGIMSLVYSSDTTSEEMAKNINSALEKTGFENLGVIERPGILVLRKTAMPAVLVEAGFIDNRRDNQIFDNNLNEIAAAIANGILETIHEEKEAVPEYYQVQVGAFGSPEMARALTMELKAQGYPAFYVYTWPDSLYKVRAGAFLNLDNAVRMEQELRRNGYGTMIVREKAIL